MSNASDPKRPDPCTLEEAVTILEEEREYQRRRWGYRNGDGSVSPSDHNKSIFDFLVYARVYLRKAEEAATCCVGSHDAGDAFRKVVTLASAALETSRDMTTAQAANHAADFTGADCVELDHIVVEGTCATLAHANRLLNNGPDPLLKRQIERRFLLLLRLGLRYFQTYEIRRRALDGIVNARDGHPA